MKSQDRRVFLNLNLQGSVWIKLKRVILLFRSGKQKQERQRGSTTKQRKSTKRAAEGRPRLPRSEADDTEIDFHHLLHHNVIICLPTRSAIRESKKSGGKKDDKKRKSAGGDKDRERERGGGNDSFKSREFIETSEDSSSDSDHKKSKAKRKKVWWEIWPDKLPSSCLSLHHPVVFTEHFCRKTKGKEVIYFEVHF